MKRQSKFFALAIVMLAFTASTFAQVSATAVATATIVTPITINKAADMLFGNIAVQPLTGGTVILTPAGTRTTGGAGGVTLPSTTGTFNAASFTITGAAGYTYSISLPADATITMTGAGSPMAVDGFNSTPTVAAGGVLTGGNQILSVGATLSVAAGQLAGAYTSAGFTVTVNYN